MKKTLSLLLCLIMFFSVSSLATAAQTQGKIIGFSVNVRCDEKDVIDTIKWFERDGEYFLFLPSDAEMSSARVFFESDKPVFINGTEIKNGEATAAFSVANTEYILACGSAEYKLFVLKSDNIPAMYITTQSGTLDIIHESKENKEPGKIKISQNGKVLLSTGLQYIKGRGNATWKYAKKPYNIKFEEKTDLFSMGKAKKWTLLANYVDKTLLKNILAFDYGEMFSLDYTPKYQSVDLYINNEYMGNYLVTESVEVNSERVDIKDLDKANEEANPDFDFANSEPVGTGEKGGIQKSKVKGSKKWVNIPNDPKNITGGYLIELEMAKRYNEEKSGFVTDRGQPVVLKCPEAATKGEVDYISGFYQAAEDALADETGFNSKGRHYSDYFDINSFAKIYIFEELSMEVDIGLSSNFFYKPSGENKFYSGPLWDFDNAFHTDIKKIRWGIDLSNPSLWAANQTVCLFGCYEGIPTIFKYAFMHEDFRDAVNKVWNSLLPVLSVDFIELIEAKIEELSASAVMDGFRWNKNESSITYEDKLNAYHKDCGKLEEKIKSRIEHLSGGFSENTAMLCYDLNGGEGYAVFTDIVKIGQMVKTVSPEVIEKSDEIFIGWNTSPDGKGRTYRVGDRIKLKKRTTTLYARWSSQGDYSILEKAWILWNRTENFAYKCYDKLANLFK